MAKDDTADGMAPEHGSVHGRPDSRPHDPAPPDPRHLDPARPGPGGFVPERFAYGPRPVGALLPRITRPAFRRGNPAQAQIVADWELIVGPKVASMTTPRRLDRGVLTIGCSGPTAMHLHYVGVELINRINAHLGGQPVHSLKFTQAGMPRPPRDTTPVVPIAVAEAEAAVADLPDGELKSALAALGRVVIGRGKQDARRPKRFV